MVTPSTARMDRRRACAAVRFVVPPQQKLISLVAFGYMPCHCLLALSKSAALDMLRKPGSVTVVMAEHLAFWGLAPCPCCSSPAARNTFPGFPPQMSVKQSQGYLSTSCTQADDRIFSPSWWWRRYPWTTPSRGGETWVFQALALEEPAAYGRIRKESP